MSFACAALLVIGIVSYVLVGMNPPKTEASYDPANPFDLFASHATWPNSTARKIGTAAEWLHTMFPDLSSGVSHLDINGDGLVDILLHNEPVGIGSTKVYGVLLNRGDLNFDLAYKCVTKIDGSGVRQFYGDCAQ